MGSSTRLSHLFMLVSDLERTWRFYVDVLGLVPLVHDDGYMRIGGTDGFAIGFELGSPEAVGASGIEIVIEVDDVDTRYEQLRRVGVEFDGPPEDQEWGARHVWLRDPDGYRLSIFSPLRT
jgi:lactoylglutathione lyase